MATGSTTPVPAIPPFQPGEPSINYDVLVTEDDRPVDSIYAERQHWLLTTPLNESWKGPGDGAPFFCTTDVALFHTTNQPPFAPDALLSLGVSPPQGDLSLKENRSYFMWKYGKPPDALVEVVSGTDGGELTTKFAGYARLRATYYIVWDPFLYLGDKKLYCFALEQGKYVPCEPWFPGLELGLKIWQGSYQKTQATYLRWCDREGNFIPTGNERAEQEKQRAEQEKQRAEQEKQRAERLAEKLRALGVDPNQP
ncbi:MAG TPA: Uma2 family endonuclease [Gemmataceae bacterium]|nr:Uma2 family endonuclease [Gemmataceae bacterium]